MLVQLTITLSFKFTLLITKTLAKLATSQPSLRINQASEVLLERTFRKSISVTT